MDFCRTNPKFHADAARLGLSGLIVLEVEHNLIQRFLQNEPKVPFDRWNEIIERTGIDFRLQLPHVAFHREIGEFPTSTPPPTGLLDAAAWRREEDKWLPSTADGDFIASLMKPMRERGQFAGWIAPPRVGIDNKPGDFEYVRLAA
jgi:hypothetical protein